MCMVNRHVQNGSGPCWYKHHLSESFWAFSSCPFWVVASVLLALPFLRVKVPQTAPAAFCILYIAPHGGSADSIK